MSGPFHERAVCKCGFTAYCSFGNLFHLTHRGSFINFCPECAAPKSQMTVRVLRWHAGTWRDADGAPFNGVEPPAPDPSSRGMSRLGLFAACVIVLLLTAWIVA